MIISWQVNTVKRKRERKRGNRQTIRQTYRLIVWQKTKERESVFERKRQKDNEKDRENRERVWEKDRREIR